MICTCGNELKLRNDVFGDFLTCSKCRESFYNDSEQDSLDLIERMFSNGSNLFKVDKETLKLILIEETHEYSDKEIKDLYDKYFNKPTRNTEFLKNLGLKKKFDDWSKDKEFADIIDFFLEEFSNKVVCESCGSVIDAKLWKNLGQTRVLESNHEVEIDEEYRVVCCPVCSSIQDISMKYQVSSADSEKDELDFEDDSFDC